MKINLLIVEDHLMVREGLIMLLNKESRYHIAKGSVNGIEAFNFLKKESRKIDIAIIDICLPGMNGIELTKKIKLNFPHIQVLGLTMMEDRKNIIGMLEAGANAYVLKSSGKDQLFKALESLSKGENYWCDSVSKTVLDYLISKKKEDKKNENNQLTKREKEVLNLVLKDMNNHQIAKELHISPRTVEVHKRNLLDKTGTKSLAGLAVYALKCRLIEI